MTDHNNSNPFNDGSTPRASNGPDPGDSANVNDEAWRDFLAEHHDDLGGVKRSRTAHAFEKQARRIEKQALLNAADLNADAFVDGIGAGTGPRDFTGSSWLDADEAMDGGSDFVPPNPVIGPVRTSKLVFIGMVVVGVLALVGCVLLPNWSSPLGAVGGALTILGAAGLLMMHKGHTETRSDIFDDGARV
ncbi:hypothetical protein [Bifidobacterium sp. UBA744]|uniref:hypothetical protein n=1 Tax=Bifidobacterium sp. UBA744 TaxID=1946112 RepID=UPI0025C4F635|nr:hypothetical protein [Bifidobacterium sp. UBA744]